jgi:hypothetical protein
VLLLLLTGWFQQKVSAEFVGGVVWLVFVPAKKSRLNLLPLLSGFCSSKKKVSAEFVAVVIRFLPAKKKSRQNLLSRLTGLFQRKNLSRILLLLLVAGSFQQKKSLG